MHCASAAFLASDVRGVALRHRTPAARRYSFALPASHSQAVRRYSFASQKGSPSQPSGSPLQPSASPLQFRITQRLAVTVGIAQRLAAKLGIVQRLDARASHYTAARRYSFALHSDSPLQFRNTPSHCKRFTATVLDYYTTTTQRLAATT